MSSRAVVDVPTPPGGWLHPWPHVGQIAAHVGPDDWTLVGGLMVALHAATHGTSLPRTASPDQVQQATQHRETPPTPSTS